MTTEVLHSWAGNAGSSDVRLDPGTYRLVAEPVKAVDGALDHEFHMEYPAVSVATVVKTPGSEPYLVDRTGYGKFESVQDTPPTEALTAVPVAEDGRFVVTKPGLYYRITRGAGTVSLVRDAPA